MEYLRLKQDSHKSEADDSSAETIPDFVRITALRTAVGT
jgi:hypothetical protein